MMSRPKQPKARDDGSAKKSGKLSKNEAKRREDKLKMNLHMAEIGQVEEYIKNRSMEVDKEIEETRKRMNLSMSLSKELKESMRDPVAKKLTEKANLHLEGHKMKEGITKESTRPSNHTQWEMSSDRNKNPTRDVEWRGLKDRLVECLRESQMTPFQVTETFLPSELAREKEVFLLLDEVIDVFQIDFVNPMTENDRDILLHFYGDKRKTCVNIRELLTDLKYWDTNRKNHTGGGVRDSGFPIKFGDEDDDLDRGLPEHYKHNTHVPTDPRARPLLKSAPILSESSLYPISEKRQDHRDEDLDLDLDAEDVASSSSAMLFTNSAGSRSALAEIHALVHASTGDRSKNNALNFDGYKEDKKGGTGGRGGSAVQEEEEDDDEKLLAMLRSNAQREKERMQQGPPQDPLSFSSLDKPTSSESPRHQQSTTPDTDTRTAPPLHRGGRDPNSEIDTDKSIRERAAENVASQLALENARLKQELGAFDSEFFEELEDLKFKYAKLQDTVGDGPVIRTEKAWDRYASSRLAPSHPVSHAHVHSALHQHHHSQEENRHHYQHHSSSVDSLPWGTAAARASSHAMDRARLTSSLVGSRPSVHSLHSVSVGDQYWAGAGTGTGGGGGGGLLGSPGRDTARGIGYRASRTIDGRDLKSSIKEQLQSSADQGEFGSLCERRLIFELKSLPDPSKAASNLMHWVAEQSHMNKDHVGFISCDQLQHLLVRRLGLKMSQKEISLLAMGFASDGGDKINAEEFNAALQTLFHSSLGAEAPAETQEEAAWRLALETIRNLASDLLTHKKFSHLLRHRSVILKLVEAEDEAGLGAEVESLKDVVSEAVCKPFHLMDDNRNGIITAKGFTKIINFFSPGISHDEVHVLVIAFKKPPSAADQSRRENDYITEYRAQQLRGSLRGAASGTGNSDMRCWLQHTLPAEGKTEGGHGSEEKVLVAYREFIDLLAEAVLDLILDLDSGLVSTVEHETARGDVDREGGGGGGSTLPPLMTGFGDLLDTLLSHLESLPSSRRRQCLLQLQTALTKQSEAEGHAEGVGYLDGFAVLKALVAAGFPLARSLRAKFLKNVEEMSGKFNFLELCRFLMSCCCDWPSEERQVMSKVLKAMGVTTEQRRQWIIQLKKDLCLASADYKLNHGGHRTHKGHPVSFNASKSKINSGDQNWLQIVEDNLEDGVPASTFLHCLREAGVHLSVDDEATLLDCLDFESQALESTSEEVSGASLLTSAEHTTHGTQGSGLSVSLIKYSNFLSVCSRHAGKWYQAAPALNEHLKVLLMSKSDTDVTVGLKEFKLLLKTFDEESTGRVSYRPFLISCRRSRLLSQLESEVTTELAKELAEEGAGTVAYELFLLHLKSLHHQLQALRSLNKEVVGSHKAETFHLFSQLLTNCCDKHEGTLEPLRRWILRVTERTRQMPRHEGREEEYAASSATTRVLTRRDVADLLRDFNVVYSPEDMDVLFDDVKMSSAMFDYFTETDVSPLHHLPRSSDGSMDELSVPPSNLIHCLMQVRPAWTQRNPNLTLKVKKLLARASTKAVETLISRLKSFARYTNLFPGDDELVIDFADDEDGEEEYAELMDKEIEKPPQASKQAPIKPPMAVTSAEAFISKDAFSHVVHSCGLNLSAADIDFFADESDASVEPKLIRVGILVEALADSVERGGLLDVLSSVREQLGHEPGHGPDKSGKHVHDTLRGSGARKHDGEETPAFFALKHLQTLLQNSADVLRRSPAEWSCDVISLMDGFDRGGGVCTPEDFVLGLRLLSVRISGDILANIPRVSKSVDMIPYKKLLETVFASGIQAERSSGYVHDRREETAYEDSGGETGQARSGRSSSAPRQSRGHGQGHGHGQGQGQCPQAVHSLVHMVRKRLNIFIAGNKADDELALSTLLAVFSRFDQNRDEFITPRNFCLAVSVLMDGDIPLLTQADWEAVVHHFQQSSVVNKHRHSNQHTSLTTRGKRLPVTDSEVVTVPAGMVHYMSFVRTVLDAAFAVASSHNGASAPSSSKDGASGSRRGVPTSYAHSKPRPSSTGRSVPPSRTTPGAAPSSSSSTTSTRASYQPVHFGNHGEAVSKKKPKSYVKSNRIAMSSRPAMFRADYDEDEDEEEFAQTNTLSGRGVVGAASSNGLRRSNLRHLSAPHVESRYSAYDLLDESMDAGSLSASQSLTAGNKSAATLRQEATALHDINKQLNKGRKSPVDYTVAIRELNDELQNILSAKAQATRGKSTMSAILRTHLQMEDCNNSGTLSKHSTLAALNGLGVVYHFWSKPSQKQLMEALMARSGGVVNIEEFMKIVYLL